VTKPDPGSNSERANHAPGGGMLNDRRVWIFDLDNTLYPADSNLFAQIDQRMGAFIADYLDLPFERARHLQKLYYRQYGTTLSGLMQVHNMNPQEFLDYVHDIDLAPVPVMPELAAAIKNLPGRKLIYTNGSRPHAERVADKLGVLNLFDGITDIASSKFIPKPAADAYELMIKEHDVDPAQAVMFEDMPQNLTVPHDMGMATVLVHSSYFDHPIQTQIEQWDTPPDHVHYMTKDLTAFLRDLELGS